MATIKIQKVMFSIQVVLDDIRLEQDRGFCFDKLTIRDVDDNTRVTCKMLGDPVIHIVSGSLKLIFRTDDSFADVGFSLHAEGKSAR